MTHTIHSFKGSGFVELYPGGFPELGSENPPFGGEPSLQNNTIATTKCAKSTNGALGYRQVFVSFVPLVERGRAQTTESTEGTEGRVLRLVPGAVVWGYEACRKRGPALPQASSVPSVSSVVEGVMHILASSLAKPAKTAETDGQPQPGDSRSCLGVLGGRCVSFRLHRVMTHTILLRANRAALSSQTPALSRQPHRSNFRNLRVRVICVICGSRSGNAAGARSRSGRRM